jgi:hypothetical protein
MMLVCAAPSLFHLLFSFLCNSETNRANFRTISFLENASVACNGADKLDCIPLWRRQPRKIQAALFAIDQLQLTPGIIFREFHFSAFSIC